MARSIDLFIDFDRQAEELAALIGRASGLALSPSGDRPGVWTLEQGSVHAELWANPYADDGDLRLSRYGYALSAHVAQGTRLSDAPETAFLRLVADSLRTAGIPTLLVHDLQYRDHEVARRAGRPGEDLATEGVEPEAEAEAALPGEDPDAEAGAPAGTTAAG
jgi:hypothetical protein